MCNSIPEKIAIFVVMLWHRLSFLKNLLSVSSCLYKMADFFVMMCVCVGGGCYVSMIVHLFWFPVLKYN